MICASIQTGLPLRPPGPARMIICFPSIFRGCLARPRDRSLQAGFASLLIVLTGCDDPTALRPDDVRVYETAKETPVAQAPAVAEGGPETRGGLALRYEPPPGWTDRGPAGMRLASLAIGTPSDGHEVTVIPAAGTLEANVSRWAGQLDSAATAAVLAERTTAALEAAETVDVDGVKGTIVMLTVGPESDRAADEAILGAAIPLDDNASLFVKFKGPAEVARRERDNFVRFVSSIRWK